VLGPNGAGKTTVLQMAAGRLFPTEGQVHILGERLGTMDTSELRTRIGLASAALADRIPGSERVLDVVLTASYGVTGRWREDYDEYDTSRADDLLAAFGVLQLRDRTFGSLSEGERERVQIARALMADPAVLLSDEATTGLDVAAREQLLTTLDGLAATRPDLGTLTVTHHFEELPSTTTHALLLKAGRIVASGPVNDVLTSNRVSDAFDHPISVTRSQGRWAARAAAD